MGRKREVVRHSLVNVDVLDEVSYIDSVFVILPRLMPKHVFRALRLALLAERRRPGQRYVLKRRDRPDGSFFFVIAVHQPTRRSLEILSEIVSPAALQARVLEVHVALDLVTSSFTDAETLQRYVEERLLPSTRLNKPVHFVGKTTYYNRLTRKGAEVALYSDRLSKSRDAPCLHVEWRTIGAQPLKSAGLKNPSDLISLNHRSFWKNRLSLWSVPSAEALLSARVKELRRTAANAPMDTETLRRQVRVMLKLATGWHGGVVANDLLHSLYKSELYHKRPKRLFTDESHTWMLPAATNALWGQ